jgi:hypothetical protein
MFRIKKKKREALQAELRAGRRKHDLFDLFFFSFFPYFFLQGGGSTLFLCWAWVEDYVIFPGLTKYSLVRQYLTLGTKISN